MSSSQGPADDAADLLIHYFRTLGGIDRSDWDPDYSAEIRNIVDRLMDGARIIAREEIKALEARVRETEEALVSAEGHIRRIERLAHGHGGAA